MECGTSGHTELHKVTSSGWSGSCCCRRTQHTIDNLPTWVLGLKHMLGAYLRVSDLLFPFAHLSEDDKQCYILILSQGLDGDGSRKQR